MSDLNRKMAVLAILFCGSLMAAPLGLQSDVLLEGRVGIVAAGPDEGSDLVHMERLHWNLANQHSWMNLNYRFSLGGMLRQSTAFNDPQLVPEFRVNARMNPMAGIEVGLFSYSQLRNPMQILQDSLKYQEQVHGFQLRTPISQSGTLMISTGVRIRDLENRSLDHPFIKFQLEQRMLGMNFRLSGDQNSYTWQRAGENAVSSTERTYMTLQWYGSPLQGVQWTSVNSYFGAGGDQYWRVYQRLHSPAGRRGVVWAQYSQDLAAYRNTDLLRRSYDLTYRHRLNENWGADVASVGNRVTPIDEDPVVHWRAYRAGLNWHYGNASHLAGLVQAGFKESYRFGKGIDTQLEAHEIIDIIQNRVLNFQLQDHLEGEFFIRLDAEGDPLYDLDHQLQLAMTFFPGQTQQIRNNIRLMNHFGADLDFSEDTLRNAVTHDLQYKLIKSRLRVSVNHLTLLDLGDELDTRLHLNTRFSYRVKQGVSLNLLSMYRYSSDLPELYPDYLWLTGFLKVDMRAFEWALDIEAQGRPEDVFQQDLRIWMRFMRQI